MIRSSGGETASTKGRFEAGTYRKERSLLCQLLIVSFVVPFSLYVSFSFARIVVYLSLSHTHTLILAPLALFLVVLTVGYITVSLWLLHDTSLYRV